MIKYIYLGDSTWEFIENDVQVKVPWSKVGDSLDTALQRHGLYLLTEKELSELKDEIKSLKNEIENANEYD